MNGIILPEKMPLNDMSWKGIQAVARSGKAGEYWQPGDTKRIKLNGVVAGFSFDEYPLDVFVLGIDHNPSLEGYNHIHFGITLKKEDAVDLLGPNFHLNLSYTNQGGWEQSYVRTDVLGADKNPSDPADGTLLAALPRPLREVMVPVCKYTDNTSGEFSREADATCTRDSLWFLAEQEIEAFCHSSNPREGNRQARYDFFKKYPAEESGFFTLTRSKVFSSCIHFCYAGDMSMRSNHVSRFVMRVGFAV